MQVTSQVMRLLGEERKVTAALTSLRVSGRVKLKPPRRQHKENEGDCRTISQQLVSSIPQNVLTSTSYKRKEQVKGTQRKTVIFEDQDQKGEEIE